MKITAVHVDTLELAMEQPFVIASSALSIGPCDLVRVETDEGITNAVHCDADLPWRPGGMTRNIGRGLKQEVVDGVSWIDVPDCPGLGIELVEEHVGPQRVARRW